MKFLIHDNLPRLGELLSGRGELRFFSGRTPPDELLIDTQVLFIRSITKVDAALLEKAPQLQFVGTGTIGTEHVDLSLLRARGIDFASAPGANSISVGEYILAAALNLACRAKVELTGKRALIIGAGHTGTQAGKRLSALGMEVQYIDPAPVIAAEDKTFVDWTALPQADLISCHVPLERTGQWPTYHLFDERKLAELKTGAIFINASRGAVVDNEALFQRLQPKQPKLWVALDVWEGEPQVRADLIPLVHIATPHIAGHSIEGKLRGSLALVNALNSCLGIEETSPLCSELALLANLESQGCLTLAQQPLQKDIEQLVKQVYDIEADDAVFRKRGADATGFELLRKDYTERRELSSLMVKLSTDEPVNWQKRLRTLGFAVESAHKET